MAWIYELKIGLSMQNMDGFAFLTFSLKNSLQGHLFTEVLVMLSFRCPHLLFKDNQTTDAASHDL